MSKPLNTSPYDSADYLKTGADIAGYIEAVLELPDVTEGEIAHALGVAARARGMMQIARDAGVSREALYRALSEDGNPTLGTLLKVMHALGLRLSVAPAMAA